MAWDNIKFKRIAIKSVDLGFPLGATVIRVATVANDAKNQGGAGSEAESDSVSLATHQQMTMLIHMVRNVGIGLAILLIILHFLR